MKKIVILVVLVVVLAVAFFAIRGSLPQRTRFHKELEPVLANRASYAKEAGRQHVDFDRFFEADTMFGIPLRRVDVGEVQGGASRIVACDPIRAGDASTTSFKGVVPAGVYPATLCVGTFGDWGDRVAFARLKFADGDVVRWEAAEFESGDILYTAASDLASFSDLASARLLARTAQAYAEERGGDYYEDVLRKDLSSKGKEWGIHFPDKESRLNVAVFPSGLGEGRYASYWGLDEDGVRVCLVTDFQLFTDDASIFHR